MIRLGRSPRGVVARFSVGVLPALAVVVLAASAASAAPPASTPSLSIIEVTSYYCNDTSNPGVLDFPVTLSARSTSVVTVDYATRNGGVSAGTNYVATSGTLTFSPGVTTQTISVTVFCPIPGPAVGGNFYVDLSNAVNATIARATADGFINEGPTPTTTGGKPVCHKYACG